MFLLVLTIGSWWTNNIPFWANFLFFVLFVLIIMFVLWVCEKIRIKKHLKNDKKIDVIFDKYKNKYQNINSNNLVKNQLKYLQKHNVVVNMHLFDINISDYSVINVISNDEMLTLNMFVFNNDKYTEYNFHVVNFKEDFNKLFKLVANKILVFNNREMVNQINGFFQKYNYDLLNNNIIIYLELKIFLLNSTSHHGMFAIFLLKLLKIKFKKKQLVHDNDNFEIVKEKNLNLQKINHPVFGIYNNFFGCKQSIQTRKLIYVEEKNDSCPLCRSFENQILSLDEYDPKYVTIYEAMSQGFHHLGCTHNKIDYLPNNTIIPTKRFTVEIQNQNYELKKQGYWYSFNIFKLKSEINNSQNIEDNKKMLIKLSELETQFAKFLSKNNLNWDMNKFNEFNLLY